MKKRNLPLDFFSFHGYAFDPKSHAESAVRAKQTMEAYGYPDAEIILNEWNYVRKWAGEEYKLSRIWSKQLKGASFIAGSMIAAQKSPMDIFMYYDARPGNWCGLFDTDTLDPLKPYYTFPMFNTLYKLGGAVKADTDSEKLWALAASGEDGAAAMFTYYDDADDAAKSMDVKLSFASLDGAWKLTWTLLDEAHDAEVVREDIVTGGTALYLTLPLYSVYQLKLEKMA
jgi:hypothetical protein